MLDYILGNVICKDLNSITIDLRGIGFKIFVSDTSFYKKDEEYKVFVYLDINDNVVNLYGFENVNQRELFEKLISINGIGPKTSISILRLGSPNEIIDQINNENVEYLRNANNVSTKIAQQIILSLKNKINISNILKYENSELEDARSALLSLSFKKCDVDKYLSNPPSELKTSKEYFKYVLKCIGNSRGNFNGTK